jgi:4-hydroxy-tetrahydrodipicolinate synthase
LRLDGRLAALTEAERQEGVARLVAAGVPTIVGTGAVNTREAVSHAAHAARVGAHGLMVIPRVLSRGASPTAQKPTFPPSSPPRPTCRR